MFNDIILNENVVYSQKPDFKAKLDEYWGDDGDCFYCHTKVVDEETTSLFCFGPIFTGLYGYIFSYEVFAQSIQARGKTADGIPGVADTWKFSVNNDTLNVFIS